MRQEIDLGKHSIEVREPSGNVIERRTAAIKLRISTEKLLPFVERSMRSGPRKKTFGQRALILTAVDEKAQSSEERTKTQKLRNDESRVRFLAAVSTCEFLEQYGFSQEDQERLSLLAMDVFELVFNRITKAGGTMNEFKAVFKAADHYDDAYMAGFKELIDQE